MLGLTPDQQAHLFHAAAISLVLLSACASAWYMKQYTLRGICKRLRCHL
jgi:hypothetical protein